MVANQSDLRSQVSSTDLDLHEAVSNIIHQLTIIRETQAPIEVTVNDGVVTLAGLIFTETMRRMILYNVSRIPGVTQIVDRLRTDAQIQVAAAQALAADPAVGVRQGDIFVMSYHGVVSLNGTVRDQNERMAAIVAVKGVAGVRDIADRLTVLAA